MWIKSFCSVHLALSRSNDWTSRRYRRRLSMKICNLNMSPTDIVWIIHKPNIESIWWGSSSKLCTMCTVATGTECKNTNNRSFLIELFHSKLHTRVFPDINHSPNFTQYYSLIVSRRDATKSHTAKFPYFSHTRMRNREIL